MELVREGGSGGDGETCVLGAMRDKRVQRLHPNQKLRIDTASNPDEAA